MADVTFLINTPSHKRWMLPDGVHYFNSVLYGDTIKHTIWNRKTHELVMSLPTVDITKKNYQDICDLAHELARKKFAKRPEQYRRGRH